MSCKVNIVYSPDADSTCELPLFLASVQAGFPSPADDYIEGKLDLNKHLIKHPSATFFVRVSGDSMIKAGIHSGDLLIVDRALEPADKSVVIAIINAELTVKRMIKHKNRLFLAAENENYQPMEIQEGMDFEVWGVVTHVIHPV